MMNKEECKIDGKMEAAVRAWYEQPKYNRYWTHYSQMKAWFHSQRSMQKPLQEYAVNSWLQVYYQYYLSHQWWVYLQSHPRNSFPNHPHLHLNPSSSYHHLPPSPLYTQTFSHPFGHTTETRYRHQSHPPYEPHPATAGYRVNSKQYITDQSDVDYLDNCFSETQPEDEEEDVHGIAGEEEEFEIELSEEMRQFFLQSQKHREELKELRLTLNKGRERGELEEEETVPKTHPQEIGAGAGAGDEHEALIQFSSSKRKKKCGTCAPSEQPGKKRAEAMKILYGNSAPAIHGMETAIQMQFDRNCDRKQPSFWPTVPLKM